MILFNLKIVWIVIGAVILCVVNYNCLEMDKQVFPEGGLNPTFPSKKLTSAKITALFTCLIIKSCKLRYHCVISKSFFFQGDQELKRAVEDFLQLDLGSEMAKLVLRCLETTRISSLQKETFGRLMTWFRIGNTTHYPMHITVMHL